MQQTFGVARFTWTAVVRVSTAAPARDAAWVPIDTTIHMVHGTLHRLCTVDATSAFAAGPPQS